MQSIIKRTIVQFLSVNRVTGLVMANDTEVDRKGPPHLFSVQRPGILPGDGGVGTHLAILEREKTVQGLVRRLLADQRAADTAPCHDMLAEAEKRRVAVAFSTADRLLAGVVGVKGANRNCRLPLY